MKENPDQSANAAERRRRALVLDLTERTQAEQALRESEARKTAMLESALDCVVAVDSEGNVTEFNRAAERTFGYRRKDVMGKKMAPLLIPPARREEHRAGVVRYKATGKSTYLGVEKEMTAMRTDGAEFPVALSVVPFSVPGATGFFSVIRDLTERKRAEEALVESETRLRSLFDNMEEGVAYCRMLFEDGRPQDFIYLEVNSAFETLTGLKNVTGRKVSEVISGIREADPQLFEIYGRVALTGQAERFETYVAALGIWVSVSAYCPAKEHFVTVFDVITERKRAEKRMRLFSREIIAAREEERRQVSSVLHHDVGSLAVGISAHLDAIEEGFRSGKPGEVLKWIKRTRKLFDRSVVRLRGLAVQLRPPELDVLGLRAALRQHFSQATKHRGVRIHLRDNLGRRRVSGDTATTLFRVAQEALSNALKHGRANRVDVGLRASKKEIRLTVRDNGKGFNPSEHLARETPQIGLRVMQEMAVSAGGAFAIDSGRKKGTTVRVRLPVAAVKRSGS